MTRGTGFLLLPDRVFESTEFNGDMYPEGYGDIFIKALSFCKNESNFRDFIKDFNELYFNYGEELVYPKPVEKVYENHKGYVIDFNNDYFGRFFSDWIFFKNLTGKTVIFIERELGRSTELLNEGTIRFNFGSLGD